MDRSIFEFNGHVKYPGIVAAKRALQGLIQEAVDAGDEALAALRRERYDGLTYKDIELENLIQFPDGRILVCIVARDRGWLRWDMEIGVADMFDIISEYNVPMVEVNSLEDLRDMITDKSDIEPRLVYQVWNNKFGLIVQNEKDCNSIPDLLGRIRFSLIKRMGEPFDPISLMSGSVLVEDTSVGSEQIAVYIREDYEAQPPDPDDMICIRTPMVQGMSLLTFKLNKTYQMPTWNITVESPDLEVGETKVAADGQSATVELSLKLHKEYYPGIRKVKVTATVSGDVWSFDKDFEHTPVSFSSYSGSNNISNVLTASFGTWGGNSAVGFKAYGPVNVKYESDDKVPIKSEFTAEITSSYGSGSTFYVKFTCPEFERPGGLRFPVMIDGNDTDSSNWTEGRVAVTMHPPVGATKIIVEPISVVRGETDYDFIGTIKLYWNDEAKTPVDNPRYEDLKLEIDPKHNTGPTITQTADGYKLHFWRLEEAPIDVFTLLARARSYSYTGYPFAWFEHRYNYTGGEQTQLKWDRMIYSNQRGVVKMIDDRGVTLNPNWTKVGFQEGIWSTCTDPKPVADGVGHYVVLDMHIVQYNRPASELTVISLNDGTKQHDLETVFDYKPVDFGTLSAVYDGINRRMYFTVTLPPGGIKAEDLIVERDYNYGDQGTVTTGWIRDSKVINENTVTFTCNPSWNPDETFYRIWFSNAKELTSSYRWTDTVKHNP